MTRHNSPTARGSGRHRAAAPPRHRAWGPRLLVVGLVIAGTTMTATFALPRMTEPEGPAVKTSALAARAVRDAPLPTVTPTPTAAPVPPKPVGPPGLKQLDRTFKKKGMARVSAQDLEPMTFRVASYNVLGASHTQGKGARKGYAGAGARLPHQINLMEAHGVTVAGLQEFQHPQAYQLQSLRGSGYDAYPGLDLGERLSQNSIVWRTDTWSLVSSQTTGIPYFGGVRVPMPQVLLQHRASGRTVWFGNFHNPADIGSNHARWRQEALRIEASLAQTLGADGTPVIMTGDFNDRAEFACPFSQLSAMHSPDGAATVNGSCRTPSGMSVDWIFGSTNIAFAEYAQDWSSRDRRLSDHPLIAASATVSSIHDEDTCRRAKSRAGVQTYCPTK